MQDSDAHVRAAAAEALSEAGPLAQPAVEELARVLEKDADDDARMWACLALGNTGPGAKTAVPVLIHSLLHDEYLGVRVNTAGALGQIRSDPDKVIPALVESFLKDQDPEVRKWDIMSLSCFSRATAPGLAQRALEAQAKDPGNHKLPEFQERVSQLRGIIEPLLRPQATPADKGSSSRSK